jgi:AcrR family transcriptional regulator
LTAGPELRSLSPRAAEIVAKARKLLEEVGEQALTMRRLAEELGIQAPSLYKHVPGKDAIKVALIEIALSEAGRELHSALARGSGDDIFLNLLRAYRKLALNSPNLYRLATAGPLPRELLTPGLEAWAGEPFLLATGDANVARALWSFAHGMVILEIDGRYPPDADLDEAWTAGAAAFVTSTR